MKLPSPNRIAVYLTALAGLITALLPVVTDLGLTEVAGILGGLAAVTAASLKFLSGWQQYEGAIYQVDLIEKNRVARIEAEQAAAEAVAAVSRPGQSKVRLPR